jgi:hypothetical protein
MEDSIMSSLDLKTFTTGFYKFVANFEFSYDKIYTQMIYDALKNEISDEIFIETCNKALKEITKQKWNEAYGYKGRPAVADWVNYFISQTRIETNEKYVCEYTGELRKKIVYTESYQKFLDSKKPKKLHLSD